MNPTHASLAFRTARKKKTLNLISFIDILLFLVIFYMLTAQWIATSGIAMQISTPTLSTKNQAAETLTLQLKANHKIEIANQEIALEELNEFLRTQKNLPTNALLKLHKTTTVQEMISVLEMLEKNGVGNMSVVK